jgi:hypothetical protein
MQHDLFVGELVVLHTTPFMFGKFSVLGLNKGRSLLVHWSVKLIMALQKVLK